VPQVGIVTLHVGFRPGKFWVGLTLHVGFGGLALCGLLHYGGRASAQSMCPPVGLPARRIGRARGRAHRAGFVGNFTSVSGSAIRMRPKR
jgi:hypothetical protein